MTKAEQIAREDWRQAHVPRYDDQKLRRGVFSVNRSYVVNISHAAVLSQFDFCETRLGYLALVNFTVPVRAWYTAGPSSAPPIIASLR